MDIRSYIEAINAGGPGSGCTGPNCGRPAGHVGPHGTKAPNWAQQKHDEKLKQKAFNKERRRINKLVKQGVPHTNVGKIKVAEKKELKKQGQLIPMKGKPNVLNTDVSRVVKTYVQTVKVYNETSGKFKKYKVEIEQVKMLGGPSTPAMGKTKGKNVPGGPPTGAHTLYGKFVQSHAFNEGNRQFRAYEATTSIHETLRGPISGAGASLFVNKETEGNKSTTSIQEVKRGPNAHIEETNMYRFKSGKAAKDFLHQRYGIKNVQWTGAPGLKDKE